MARKIRDSQTELERLLAKVFDESGEGIVITDGSGTILEVNEGYCAIMGYDRGEAIGQNPRFTKSGVHEPDFYEDMWRALAGDGRWQGEVWDRRKNGELAAKLLSISAVRDDSGQTTHYVGIFRDVTQAKQTEARLEQLAHYDHLTNLPNRLLLLSRLHQAMDRATEHGQQVAVLLLDLDRFQEINDSLGHRAGDLILVAVGERLSRSVRSEDTVARLGGDEFVVILPAVRTTQQVALAARELLGALEEPFRVSGREVFVQASVGLTMFPFDGSTVDELLRNADTAMNSAKRQGRNRHHFYSAPMHARALERLDLEAALRRSLERDELTLHYQPQVDAESHVVTGVEALVRWNHPTRGLVPPGDFIPLAEECGAIGPIDEWVLRQACERGSEWHRAGLGPIKMSVNQGSARFREGGLASSVAAVLEDTGMPPDLLCIEITESTAMSDAESARETIRRLDEMGVEVAIDDFGTGYSSLVYLKRFDVDWLKIPQNFVQDVTTDPDDRAITEAIVAVARALGLRIVAEGVERRDQLELLRDLGCDVIQGFLFARPQPAKEARASLERGTLDPG